MKSDGAQVDSLLSSIRYRIPVAQPALNTSQLLGQVQKALCYLSSLGKEEEGLLTEVGFEFAFALN